jgi:hypothetical protein
MDDFIFLFVRTITRNRGMRTWKFVSWFANGAVHGALTFYFFSLLWSSSFLSSGMEAGHFAFGLVIFHGVVITVNWKLFITAHLWTFYLVVCSFLSVASLFVFLSIYTSFKWQVAFSRCELMSQISNQMCINFQDNTG